RGCNDLSQIVAAVEFRRFLDLGNQFSGHGRARLVVLRVVIENCRVECPMLVELRGELYEVAGHLRAGKTRIHGVCEHAMQSMAEFVEHGGYIAEADEGGLAGAGLGEIGDVEYHRYQAE